MKKILHAAAVTLVLAVALSACVAPPADPAATPAAPDPTAAPPPTAAPAPTATPLSPTEQAPPDEPANEPNVAPPPLVLTSAAFETGTAFPVQYACHGDNVSPPLAWGDPPGGTQSFALILDDPDAEDVVGFVWVHWLLFDLPAEARDLPAAVPVQPELPDGSRQGLNSANVPGYSGPCPPSGQTHNYVFTLLAVDAPLGLEGGATQDEIVQALEGHVLASGQLVGPYTSP